MLLYNFEALALINSEIYAFIQTNLGYIGSAVDIDYKYTYFMRFMVYLCKMHGLKMAKFGMAQEKCKRDRSKCFMREIERALCKLPCIADSLTACRVVQNCTNHNYPASHPSWGMWRQIYSAKTAKGNL